MMIYFKVSHEFFIILCFELFWCESFAILLIELIIFFCEILEKFVFVALHLSIDSIEIL
jgi:hypothetical protein